MISGLFIFNLKGDTLICKTFRHDLKKSVTEIFRVAILTNTDYRHPIVSIGSSTYIYTKHEDLYVVAITKGNPNVMIVLEFLESLIQDLTHYFGKLNENTVKDNVSFIFELLDEMIDYGIIQTTEPDALARSVSITAVKKKGNALSLKRSHSSQLAHTTSSEIPGSVPWRRAGIKYRKNSIYIDIVERMNLLISSTGNVLRSDVSGIVKMRAMLSGMPECQFGLNDKLDFKLKQSESKSKSNNSRNPSSVNGGFVILEDCQFHQCVRLPEFENEHRITFIPPDGEVELMSYRSHENINIPFRIVPIVEQLSKQKIIYRISIRADYPHKLSSSLNFRIPVPTNVVKANPRVNRGKAGYEPSENIINWKIPRFLGETELIFYAEVELSNTTNQQIWAKPPISLDFNILMFTSSGLHVQYLRVSEPSNSKYKSIKWVRYSTRAGTCEIRI
ncbi:AP-2 complex subunit mu [Schizosaccharomyces pombe]